MPLREFVLHLGAGDLWSRMRKGHCWSVNRGRKSGLELRRSSSPRDCDEHVGLMLASRARRVARGEVVSGGVPRRECRALVAAGAGELFQAVLEGRVLSSALTLMAEQGAYYHSAGTSPEGMKRGASQWLIYKAALALEGQGLVAFNLGGVGPHDNVGLHEFKAGFGTEEVALECAEFFTGSSLRRAIGRLAGMMRAGLSWAEVRMGLWGPELGSRPDDLEIAP